MKLFSSYVLLLLGFISSVVASGGPLDIPDFLTEENTKCSDRMPKYDESGRELGSMERSLRGDWHRMPHPHNLVWILFNHLCTSHTIRSLVSTGSPSC